MSDDDRRRTAWERSMHPRPSVPGALSHFAAELFGSLFVVAASLGLIAAVVLVGGGTGGGLGHRLVGLAIASIAVPLFAFGRYLIVEHAVSPRRWDGDDGDGRGGGGPRPVTPPPPPGSLRERHVVASRRPPARPVVVSRKVSRSAGPRR